jgi:hypothetical protein
MNVVVVQDLSGITNVRSVFYTQVKVLNTLERKSNLPLFIGVVVGYTTIKIFLIIFQKPLDKRSKVWYNYYSKKKKRGTQK